VKQEQSATPISDAGVAGTPAPPAELGRPGRALGTIAGIMILSMMVVTTIDVIGRDLFNVPLFGAFEMTEILMGLVIFAGMPLTSAAREHITVNLFESVTPRRVRCLQAGAGDILSAAVAAVMAWRIYWRGMGLIDARETTMMLGIGRGYIAVLMALLLAVTASVFLYSAYRAFEAAAKRP
jgi:TRAP-type C4-dicarboxylate transport system permease small subunit